MKSVQIIFEDNKYNYVTSVNGGNKEVHDYFVNKQFSFDDGNGGYVSKKCIGFRWMITTSPKLKLYPVMIYNPSESLTKGALYDPETDSILNIDHRPLEGNIRPYYNDMASIIATCDGGLVNDVQVTGFPVVHCHDNVYRVAEEIGPERIGEWL